MVREVVQPKTNKFGVVLVPKNKKLKFEGHTPRHRHTHTHTHAMIGIGLTRGEMFELKVRASVA